MRVQDTLPAEQMAATAKAVADYKVDYVGIGLHLDGLAVEATSGDAAQVRRGGGCRPGACQSAR